jgi:hypothetical protein
MKGKHKMKDLVTRQDYLEFIAIETANMSFPGSMGRGEKKVVKAGTKEKLKQFFASDFPLQDIFVDAKGRVLEYDRWHDQQVAVIARFLETEDCLGNPENTSYTIGAKFLNTFMHQLMKYEWARSFWKELHLPLDSYVLQAFAKRKRTSPAIEKITQHIGAKTAYSLSREDYQFVQNILWDFIAELNGRTKAEVQFHSRIELNYLWV